MRNEFPEGFFQKSRPIATHETLADISEPMQVSEEVLSGKKKLFLTTKKPKRKRGKWIEQNLTGYLTPGGNGIWHCSECGHQEGPYPSAKLTDYCPNCGADMREIKIQGGEKNETD